MMSDYIFHCIFASLFGILIGWIFAHSSVATECQKIGAFYVGEHVYYCERIIRK